MCRPWGCKQAHQVCPSCRARSETPSSSTASGSQSQGPQPERYTCKGSAACCCKAQGRCRSPLLLPVSLRSSHSCVLIMPRAARLRRGELQSQQGPAPAHLADRHSMFTTGTGCVPNTGACPHSQWPSSRSAPGCLPCAPYRSASWRCPLVSVLLLPTHLGHLKNSSTRRQVLTHAARLGAIQA